MQTPKKPIKKPVTKKDTGKSDSYRASVDKMLTGKYQGTRPRMEDAFTGKGIFYKTGGMVNPNASVQASKVASGRPAKSAEPKSAAKKATGKTGGISKAPKTAVPKAKYGMVMRKK